MLRSLSILVTTLLGFMVIALVIWKLQPNPAATVSTTGSVDLHLRKPTGQTHAGVGPGKGLWSNSYEKGQLKSQFFSREFLPQPDHSLKVIRPISVYYLDKGQYLMVTGKTGQIFTDSGGPAGEGDIFSGTMQQPRSGKLFDVQIAIYPSISAMRPTLWMTTDNIHFDNDTMRMYTESIEAADPPVPSDQVPVTLRGDDYEFDGKGLTLRWNARDNRLQELKINHGDRLEIKTLGGKSPLGGPTAATAQAAAPRVKPSTGVMDAGWSPGRNALTAMPAVFVQRVVLNSAPAAPPVLVPYRAIFNDQVRIFQGEHQSGSGDRLTFDFTQANHPLQTTTAAVSDRPLLARSSPRPLVELVAMEHLTGPASTPSSAPTTQMSADTSDEDVPLAARDLSRHWETGVPQPLPLPVPPPVGKKAPPQPITIRWTGQLLVTELTTAPLMPLGPGQSVMQLVGAPALLTPMGSNVQAAVCTYRSPDGQMRLQPSEDLPFVHVHQEKGLDLTTESVDYDSTTAIATLIGQSSLVTPLEHASGQAMGGSDQPLEVKWSQRGLLHTVKLKGSTNPSGVDQVDLHGDVSVRHPQFSLNSDALRINLEVTARPTSQPAATDPAVKPAVAKVDAGNSDAGKSESGKSESGAPGQPQAQEVPRLVTALGNVRCAVNSPGKPQGILCDKLVIALDLSPLHQSYLHTLTSDGNVQAYDPDQTLECRHLDVTLLPPAAVVKTPTAEPAPSATPPAASNAGDVAQGTQLESMHATGEVHAVLKDKSFADCDQLFVTTQGTRQVAELHRDTGARLDNGKGSWLLGSVIRLSQGNNEIAVDGPGLMHAVNAGTAPTSPATAPVKPPASPKPVDVTWTGSLAIAGDVGDVLGNVQVKSVDPDGTISRMNGDMAHLVFMTAPRPATQRADTKTTAVAAGATPMAGDKALKSLTLIGHVQGESLLKNSSGAVERLALLREVDQLIYFGAQQVVIVPGHGKMFVENHKADTKPAAGKPDSTDTATAGNNRGEMAISWKKEMRFEQLANLVTIQGDVHVGFETEKKSDHDKPEPMRMQSQKLLIWLKKSEPPKSAPAKPAPATAPADEGGLKLARLVAQDSVHFHARGVDLDTQKIDYNPDTQLLTATGTRNEPAYTTDGAGNATATFDSLIYSVEKQEVMGMTNAHVIMRK